MAKAKTKSPKVVISEPRILLLGCKAAGESARFESVHVGTAFVVTGGNESIYLKVGKTTALCLLDGGPDDVRGVKCVFSKAKRVNLVEVDLSIKLVGGQKKPLVSPGVSVVEIDRSQVHVTSDIAASVLDRAQ